MTTYRVLITYTQIDTEDLDVLEAIAATAPDAYFGSVDGVEHVDAVIDATTATDAVEQLVQAIHDAAPDAEPHEVRLSLVTVSDIAAGVGLNREAVRLWTTGKRGPGGFPAPMDTVGDRVKVWAASEVWHWLVTHSLPTDDARPLSLQEAVDGSRCIERIKSRWAEKPVLIDASAWSSPTHKKTTVEVRPAHRIAVSF